MPFNPISPSTMSGAGRAFSGGGSPGSPSTSGTWESPGGFLANVPQAAAGIAGSAAGLPWNIILPILGSLLFGGGGGESEEDRFLKEQELDRMMRRQGLGKYSWREKQQEQLSPVVLQALVNHMQRMGNWGYPEGMGIDFSFLQQGLGGGAGLPRLGVGGGAGTRRTITPGVLGG